MQFEFSVNGGDFSNAGKASSSIKKVLKQLNVDNKIIKSTVVALYEAEVNVAAHADKGEVVVDIDSERVLITLTDKGPGIEDIPKAMEAGFSTASREVRTMGFGAGMGLPNIKKNSDVFNIKSTVGEGTSLEIINYLSK